MSKIGFNTGLALNAGLVTEVAAINAYYMVGRGDEKAADQAAVDAMRTGLNAMNIKGRIVIGEGERDEAPMLYIGEEVGKGTGPEVDIALDPLEGTTLTAKAMANALAVMAFAPRGGLLYAPDVYMDKIAVGPGYAPGIIDLDKSPADNVKAIAKAKGVSVEEITVCVLDRARHSPIIDELRNLKTSIKLITDGDVQGVINTTDPDTQVDMYIGQGGAPEGVLAEKYDLEGLASGPTIFAATGVTQGDLLDGVKIRDGKVQTHTLLMNSMDNAVQYLRSERPLKAK